MHPKSFVSNFWGAVHIQSATLFFEILHIVGGYGILAVAIRVQLINRICYGIGYGKNAVASYSKPFISVVCIPSQSRVHIVASYPPYRRDSCIYRE